MKMMTTMLNLFRRQKRGATHFLLNRDADSAAVQKFCDAINKASLRAKRECERRRRGVRRW